MVTDPLLVPDGDLAVGADVDQEPGDALARDAGRDDVGHDVRADVRPDRGEQHEAAFRVDVDARIGRAQVLGFEERRDERRPADRLGIDAEQQVQHRRVPGGHDFQHRLARDARRGTHAAEQSVEWAHDGFAELFQRFGAVHLRGSPA